jgi:hypothetical protein
MAGKTDWLVEGTYLAANTVGYTSQAATTAAADKDKVARLQARREALVGRVC